jgi:hypothetical protein
MLRNLTQHKLSLVLEPNVDHKGRPLPTYDYRDVGTLTQDGVWWDVWRLYGVGLLDRLRDQLPA